MATADPKKKKKKRRKKESLEHKRNRILVALAVFIAVYALDELGVLERAFGNPGDVYTSFMLFLVPFVIAGHDVLKKAWNNIRHGKAFDESFLMAVATLGAFAMVFFPDTDPHMAEGAAVMLFYQVGELFQAYAVGKSRKSISSMMDIAPDYANIEDAEGNLKQVDPDEVACGGIIVIKPGERVPIDGTIVEGATQLDTAALTGESIPRHAETGAEVVSGCINMTGLIKVKTTKPFGESTVSRILELVENASEKKARTENFITRFARIYTPAVTGAAALLAVGGGIVTGAWPDWILRGLTFLVVSCPCALVISVPLSFFGGIGGASKIGVLVKGSNYLEALAEVDTVVFDKTGTLTRGTFSVAAVHPENGYTESSLLEMAALAESFSDHPIAQSVRAAYTGELDSKRVTNSGNDSGHGVFATIDGKKVIVGNAKMLAKAGFTAPDCEIAGTILHVLVDTTYAGHIVIADTVKDDAKQTISDLHAAGVRRCVMLTGDREEVSAAVSRELCLDEYRRSHRGGRHRADGRQALQHRARHAHRTQNHGYRLAKHRVCPCGEAADPRACGAGHRQHVACGLWRRGSGNHSDSERNARYERQGGLRVQRRKSAFPSLAGPRFAAESLGRGCRLSAAETRSMRSRLALGIQGKNQKRSGDVAPTSPLLLLPGALISPEPLRAQSRS